MCDVHNEIIALGFRESGKRGGKIEYTRGNETLRHKDYGPSARWPNPDANRHILQFFRDGRKIAGGTAWRSILQKYCTSGE